ncbi:GIY-YIG nuclease family protein [Allomuricauda sp. SCSIO 65647]|uniref:GIY-YIG nuclease family protein n=1 Tax=Allomuricauda sp. SCSIO 65647 TaxID=2908843 RepID=UPI001F272A11|nr:GIY-YIG nuclease family protein [Muricauda sp. SCSIO 65647]UJH68259.1 GIY-YIG nuclease family protein [Muricauda sp. SCSIO 65647]
MSRSRIRWFYEKRYVYILECSDETFYTGSTIDLEKRIREHQDGRGANHTKKRLPVKLVYAEEYLSIAKAFEREKQIQGWSRTKKQALINGEVASLPGLAECKNEKHYRFYKETKH